MKHKLFTPKPEEEITNITSNLSFGEKQNMLVDAIYNGSIGIVKAIVQSGFGPQLPHLELCVKYQQYSILKFFLETGADPNMGHGTLLIYACRKGMIKIVQLLLAKGADPDINYGDAVMTASLNGHYKVVSALIKKGVSVDTLDESLMKAIAASSDTQTKETVNVLLDAGADVHVQDDYPLRRAVMENAYDIVEILLKAGANVHVNNEFPLTYAVMHMHKDMVKLLIDHGADVHALHDYAIRVASERNHPPVVSLLVDAGADVDAMGGEPLILACKNGHRLVAEILVKAGATISVDHLKIAVLHSYANIVKLLIDNGVKVTNRVLTMAKLIVKEDKLTAPDRNSVYIVNMLENIVNMQEKGMKRTRTNESATSILKPKTSNEIVDSFSRLNVVHQVNMLQDNDPDFMVNGSIIPESKWPLIVKIKKALMEDDRVNQVIRTGAIATWSYAQPKYIAAFRIFDKNDHKNPSISISQHNNDNFIYVQEMPSSPKTLINNYDELLEWLKEEYIWVDFNF